MDKREAFASGTILDFPGLQCEITEEIGRGSNAVVYRGWYRDHHDTGLKHDVLIKELFPLHPKGAIYRAPDGRICRTEEGMAAWELHRRSFENGNAAHLALLQRHPDEIGANFNTYALNDTLYTVLGFSGGRSLEQELSGPARALRPLAERMLKLLDALEAFHGADLLHLDIAPDNILLMGTGRRERLMLIDYNSCMSQESARGGIAGSYSVKPGYTAPEIRGGRLGEIGPASDLYSVTAVFFHAITGAPLTPFQMSRPAPPDVSGCPCMEAEPETVRSWTRQILRRGLHTLPARRYSSVAGMRADLEELLDRIDGVGITHSALWEAGRRNVERAVRENASMAFIRDADKLFPSNAELDGLIAPVGEQLGQVIGAGDNALMIAGGGMGKTTAMLRLALEQTKGYAPDRPAIAYLSLYGWQAGERDYILNRLLETLRFKAETRSFEDARKALLELLDQPIQGREGARPLLMLMLDGLNEVSGDRQMLIDEILRLSAMRGVGIVAATRADETALPFRRLTLARLTQRDVGDALSRAGLLMPDSAQMVQLLRTPLMLSIFIQSSLAEERQLRVDSQEELMAAYFASLKQKEIASRPEDGDERWQVEAAMDFVLPALAREIDRKRRALTDAELLPTVEWCYRLLGSRLMPVSFPQWIGRSAAIRGDAENAEGWYGRVVHDILWKRMGLLIRDDQGRYQTSHQIIGEYLMDADRGNRQRVRRVRWMRQGMAAAVALVVLVTGTLAYRLTRPTPYDAAMAEQVFSEAMEAYMTAGLQCEELNDLVACAEESPDRYDGQLERYDAQNDPAALSPQAALERLNAMLATGEVIPWSGKPMNQESCEALLSLPEQMSASYAAIAARLAAMLADENVDAGYLKEYVASVIELIRKDARIAACLYVLTCKPHLTGKYRQTRDEPGTFVLTGTPGPDGEGGSAPVGDADYAVYIPLAQEQAQAAQDMTEAELMDDLQALSQERGALLETVMP